MTPSVTPLWFRDRGDGVTGECALPVAPEEQRRGAGGGGRHLFGSAPFMTPVAVVDPAVRPPSGAEPVRCSSQPACRHQTAEDKRGRGSSITRPRGEKSGAADERRQERQHQTEPGGVCVCVCEIKAPSRRSRVAAQMEEEEEEADGAPHTSCS